jgi:hypothetical protein
MVRSRDDLVLRVVEVGLGAAVVAALVVALNSGFFAISAQKFADWYATEVNGMLSVTVVSTAVTLPQVERADLPIPQAAPTELSASGDDAEAPAGPSGS